MAKNGPISHFECMHTKFECPQVPRPFKELKRVPTTALVNGRKVTRYELVEEDIRERDKGLKWYDFSIDSLQASGMLAQAAFSTLSESPMNVADKIDAIDPSSLVSENNGLNN